MTNEVSYRDFLSNVNKKDAKKDAKTCVYIPVGRPKRASLYMRGHRLRVRYYSFSIIHYQSSIYLSTLSINPYFTASSADMKLSLSTSASMVLSF